MMLSSVVDTADGTFPPNSHHHALAEELRRVPAESAPASDIVIALPVTAGETGEAGDALVEIYPGETKECVDSVARACDACRG